MKSFDEYLERYRIEGIYYLRTNVPEIKKVESLDELHDLKLTKHTDLQDLILILQYEASAPALFPAVRQRLIDMGVSKRQNVLHTSIRNAGTPDEVYNVTLGFYGARLQISLDVRRK